jgi:hypothetical protein
VRVAYVHLQTKQHMTSCTCDDDDSDDDSNDDDNYNNKVNIFTTRFLRTESL